ncbi:ABC transporter permease [Telmatospirillum sp.]|uniref:ABC transporter permease n=1 Tax=Telmatospirillum sp. TaxID=2079197 RepID=UPI0028437E94|nr:ABC transporter permease [Telmatospirillum sp.]MDR3435965.1 ABC transporter permease [Telmatospirillum sp.]
MNPWPIILADLRSLRWIAWAVPLVVAIAVAIGIAVSAQDQALRTASARAADDFDLVIGAPGSQTQLVLTTVYLQPDAIGLADGALLNRLANDKRVAAAAPIAFGDVVHGYPVVGTTTSFVSRWGRLQPAEGRTFAAENEAVIGASVALQLGATVTPSHGMAHHGSLGAEDTEEYAHRHEEAQYRIVGRLPRQNSPWDWAILVPIESVWEIHGLGNGHAVDEAPLGPPFDAKTVPGVPAILVKPKSVADAYVLRGEYRKNGTMALFPAEVLVAIYQTLGDVKLAMVVVSGFNNALVLVATVALLLTMVGLRQRRYAVLRALGAPRRYVLLAVWLGTAGLLTAGCVLGLGLSLLASWVAGSVIEARTGLHLAVTLGWSELAFFALIILCGSGMALIPALFVYRRPVSPNLRSSA